MSDSLFDSFDSIDVDPELKEKPFFKIIKKKDGELLDWLNSASEALINQSQNRTSIQRANLHMYRGIDPNITREMGVDRDRSIRRLNKVQKFIVNHLFDLTETKVSQMTRLKPAVEVLPTNDEYADRISAKVVGQLIKHIWYNNNMDDMITKMHRECRIFGESYTFVLWNDDLGDLDPAYVQARDAGIKEVKLPNGQTLKLDKPIKTGDVCFEPELPWRVLLQRKMRYDEVEYLFRVKVRPTEELKEDYPKFKNEIQSTDGVSTFDMDNLDSRFLEEHTLVFEMYHKPTKYVPKGRFIKFTKDAILENIDYPFNHEELPIIRLTDMDVPDVLNGVSRYEMISPLQNMYNNMSTLISKNIYLMAHQKWMMPRGACKIDQLGNDNTILQYQGPVAPQMVQMQPNAPEVYNFRQNIKEEMQVIYGSHGISRGEVPKGITAASALQFLNELENERATSDISKHGFLVKDLAKMTIAVVGQNYDIEDGRMLRIVGENNKYSIRHFDSAHLHKSYDVRFDNSTGLPESKSGKFQRILDAMQRNPQMMSPERWTDLLELANTEKMNSLITSALRAADSETEDLMAGRGASMPEEWEDHIQHWESHARSMQTRTFKEEADPEARSAMKDHVYWTEEAMIDKMRNNPEFEAKLATLMLFPLFHHEGFVAPRSMEQQIAMVQGQANRGDEVQGNIPGSSTEDMKAQEHAKSQLK